MWWHHGRGPCVRPGSGGADAAAAPAAPAHGPARSSGYLYRPPVQPILILALTFIAPIIGGLLLAGAQIVVYRALRREAPPFFVLFARGLLLCFVLAAVMAVAVRAVGGAATPGAG